MRLLTFILCLSHLTTADDVSPLAFNDELRDQIQKYDVISVIHSLFAFRFQPTLSTKGVVRQRHLITTLARYARIHKHFVQLPKGRHGYSNLAHTLSITRLQLSLPLSGASAGFRPRRCYVLFFGPGEFGCHDGANSN